MEARSSNHSHALPLTLTQDEVYLLLVALLNSPVDMGAHERTLCGKVRDAWDTLRCSAPDRPQEGAY